MNNDSQNDADMDLSAGTLASVPRDPLHCGPGAYIAVSDEAEAIIRSWLQRHGANAVAFRSTEIDVVIGLVKHGQFDWIAVVSAGRALTTPWFDGLLRATIESDTMLWTADDDTEFGLHLFLSMVENWEFLTPYALDSTESTSLTSVRDALSRIEARIHPAATDGQMNGPVEGRSSHPIPSDRLPSDRQILENGLALEQFAVIYKGQQCFLGNTLLFRLFECLARAPGKWFSFSELRSSVWRDDLTVDSTTGRNIRLLRAKLKQAGMTGIVIENPRDMKLHVRLSLLE